jgi:SAM-dependent methyltransferase
VTSTLPEHLAAVLANADAVSEVEPDIWRVNGASAAVAQYDTIGRAYDLVGGLDIYHRVFWGVSTREYRMFADAAVSARGAGTLLDAGCGSMLFTAQTHGYVVGIDPSLRMLRLARARLGPSPHAALLHAGALHSPFRPDAFGVVVCMNVAHVLDDLNGLLSETWRILKPGGRLFLTTVVLVDSWRDHYLGMLYRRGIMASPRRAEHVLDAVRTRFETNPAAHVKGSMLFVQVNKPCPWPTSRSTLSTLHHSAQFGI